MYAVAFDLVVSDTEKHHPKGVTQAYAESRLQSIYWFIRYQRRKNLKRKYYRQAAIEKKRLIASGVDPEELRLLCRVLAKRHCEHAERRLRAYRSKVTRDPISS